MYYSRKELNLSSCTAFVVGTFFLAPIQTNTRRYAYTYAVKTNSKDTKVVQYFYKMRTKM